MGVPETWRGVNFPSPQWLAHAAAGVIVPALLSTFHQRVKRHITCVYVGGTHI